MTDVDYKQDVWQAIHVLDTTKSALEFVQLTLTSQSFFFAESIQTALIDHLLKVFQAANRIANSPEVSQHTSQPTTVDVRHTTALRFTLNDVLRGALGAYEKDGAAIRSHASQEVDRFVEQRQGLLQVDDMNFVALPEDVGSHARVPVASLMTEVNSSLQHVAH